MQVRDDFDDPYAVVLRNAAHEDKLRDWAAMDSREKWVLGLQGFRTCANCRDRAGLLYS